MENVLSQFKKIRDTERPEFSEIINNPIELKDSKTILSVDNMDIQKIKEAAKEQAQEIINAIKENEQLKKDAEELAMMIIKEQRENKELINAAKEQALRIIELEKENNELLEMARENAKQIYDRNSRMAHEVELRDISFDESVSRTDIDKLNSLLNNLSSVKEIDFAINHPTVMQDILLLEERIVTYLKTHKNIEEKKDSKQERIISKGTVKTPVELLSIIRNVYTTSHGYEKEGRHTLINITPELDKYHVSLFSIREENDDLLTDVFFDEVFFNEDVIKELCEIFKKDAVIVACKTDNLPDGNQDYLVIDNFENAIKFMACSKEIVEIAKAYV